MIIAVSGPAPGLLVLWRGRLLLPLDAQERVRAPKAVQILCLQVNFQAFRAETPRLSLLLISAHHPSQPLQSFKKQPRFLCSFLVLGINLINLSLCLPLCQNLADCRMIVYTQADQKAKAIRHQPLKQPRL